MRVGVGGWVAGQVKEYSHFFGHPSRMRFSSGPSVAKIPFKMLTFDTENIFFSNINLNKVIILGRIRNCPEYIFVDIKFR